MKKYILFLVAIILATAAANAQKGRETRFQQIESAKIAYITNHLELTPTEAQKFFPIYNEYREEMREIMHANRSNKNNKEPSLGIEFDSKVLACKKKYHARFSTVVSASKASRFFQVEREFREQLFKELENRHRHAK